MWASAAAPLISQVSCCAARPAQPIIQRHPSPCLTLCTLHHVPALPHSRLRRRRSLLRLSCVPRPSLSSRRPPVGLHHTAVPTRRSGPRWRERRGRGCGRGCGRRAGRAGGRTGLAARVSVQAEQGSRLPSHVDAGTRVSNSWARHSNGAGTWAVLGGCLAPAHAHRPHRPCLRANPGAGRADRAGPCADPWSDVDMCGLTFHLPTHTPNHHPPPTRRRRPLPFPVRVCAFSYAGQPGVRACSAALARGVYVGWEGPARPARRRPAGGHWTLVRLARPTGLGYFGWKATGAACARAARLPREPFHKRTPAHPILQRARADWAGGRRAIRATFNNGVCSAEMASAEMADGALATALQPVEGEVGRFGALTLARTLLFPAPCCCTSKSSVTAYFSTEFLLNCVVGQPQLTPPFSEKRFSSISSLTPPADRNSPVYHPRCQDLHEHDRSVILACLLVGWLAMLWCQLLGFFARAQFCLLAIYVHTL